MTNGCKGVLRLRQFYVHLRQYFACTNNFLKKKYNKNVCLFANLYNSDDIILDGQLQSKHTNFFSKRYPQMRGKSRYNLSVQV